MDEIGSVRNSNEKLQKTRKFPAIAGTKDLETFERSLFPALKTFNQKTTYIEKINMCFLFLTFEANSLNVSTS